MSAGPGGGTTTLLFTDIEGSTRLARELGDGWEEVLARHHAILSEAIAVQGGRVEGTEGDAFFAVFDSPRDGIAAATDAQRRLAVAPGPDAPVRVRMGLHTGTVRRAATGLVGLEIHRAARVAASAHGGQVLLTETVLDGLDAATDVEDLGRHRLKDFPEPERLFHLVIDGRRADAFPPPKTLPVRPTNVPVLETPLVGRSAELREVSERLGNGLRLMTVVGQGGAGKTRLAIAAAENLLDAFPGGAWFVPLADVTSAERLLAAVADTMRLAAAPDRPVLETLADALAAAPTLLVLDNLEQLGSDTAIVGEVLSSAPRAKVLATSQAPLRLPFEHVLPLASLPADDGRRLFVEHAARRRPGFEAAASVATIDAICERLDGLPLAIELAAARTAVLTPEDLLGRLDSSLNVLSIRDSARPERQRSLRAAIEWTFSLLSPAARELGSALAVFATSFTVADAEALGGSAAEALDALEELVDFSFLRRVDTGAGDTRFTMAQTLREFARDGLTDAGQLDAVCRRHAVWAVGFLEQALKDTAHDQIAVSDRVWSRLDDVFAALAWARGRDPDLHLALAGTLPDTVVWLPRGPDLENELTIALERRPPASAHLARAVRALGGAKVDRGASEEGLRLLESAVSLWQEVGDSANEVSTLLWLVYATYRSDLDAGRAHAARALAAARQLGDQDAIDLAVTARAQVAVAAGEIAEIEPVVAETLRTTTNAEAAVGLRHLWADCALIDGDPREAAGRYAAAVRGLPAVDDSPSVTYELQGLAMSLARAGHAAEALEVERIAAVHAEHFGISEATGFWAELWERNLSYARSAVPDYVPAQPVDDLAAARDWALAVADRIAASR